MGKRRFFHGVGRLSCRELEEMRGASAISSESSMVSSILRGETPGSPPTGAPPSFDDIKTRAVTTHAGLREFTAAIKPTISLADGANSVVSRSAVYHHGLRGARSGGNALSASPWTVHDPAQGFRRSAPECGLDHLAVEAEALSSVELTARACASRDSCNYSGRAHFGPHGSSKRPSMRIGIANDMGLAREALRRVVLSSPVNEVAWMAKDGAEAVALRAPTCPT